jgi:hypothetical protein
MNDPLGKFQHTVAEKDDVLLLLRTINTRLAEVGGEPLDSRMLEENFELFWPRLQERLKEAESLSPAPTPSVSVSRAKAPLPSFDKAMLEEILELTRSQERRLLNIEDHLLPRQANAAVTRGHEIIKKMPQKFIKARIELRSQNEVTDSLKDEVILTLRSMTHIDGVYIEGSGHHLTVDLTFDQPLTETNIVRRIKEVIIAFPNLILVAVAVS